MPTPALSHSFYYWCFPWSSVWYDMPLASRGQWVFLCDIHFCLYGLVYLIKTNTKLPLKWVGKQEDWVPGESKVHIYYLVILTKLVKPSELCFFHLHIDHPFIQFSFTVINGKWVNKWKDKSEAMSSSQLGLHSTYVSHDCYIKPNKVDGGKSLFMDTS